jgi:hypothetical protein
LGLQIGVSLFTVLTDVVEAQKLRKYVAGNVSSLKVKDEWFCPPPNNKVFHLLSFERLQLLLIFLRGRLLAEFIGFAIAHREPLRWLLNILRSPFALPSSRAFYAKPSSGKGAEPPGPNLSSAPLTFSIDPRIDALQRGVYFFNLLLISFAKAAGHARDPIALRAFFQLTFLLLNSRSHLFLVFCNLLKQR